MLRHVEQKLFKLTFVTHVWTPISLKNQTTTNKQVNKLTTQSHHISLIRLIIVTNLPPPPQLKERVVNRQTDRQTDIELHGARISNIREERNSTTYKVRKSLYNTGVSLILYCTNLKKKKPPPFERERERERERDMVDILITYNH